MKRRVSFKRYFQHSEIISLKISNRLYDFMYRHDFKRLCRADDGDSMYGTMCRILERFIKDQLTIYVTGNSLFYTMYTREAQWLDYLMEELWFLHKVDLYVVDELLNIIEELACDVCYQLVNTDHENTAFIVRDLYRDMIVIEMTIKEQNKSVGV